MRETKHTLSIRIPTRLHDALKRESYLQDKSINALIVEHLTDGLGASFEVKVERSLSTLQTVFSRLCENNTSFH